MEHSGYEPLLPNYNIFAIRHRLRIIFSVPYITTGKHFSLDQAQQPAARGNMVLLETFEMRKSLFTLPLAKPGQSAEAISKIYEMLIYDDIHYTGRFIMLSVITNIYNKKNQRTYLNGIFLTTHASTMLTRVART